MVNRVHGEGVLLAPNEELVQAELTADRRLGVFVHEGVLQQGEMALVVTREVPEEVVRGDVLQDGVAKEFQTLIVAPK